MRLQSVQDRKCILDEFPQLETGISRRGCSLRARLFSFKSMTLDWQLRCVVIRGKIA